MSWFTPPVLRLSGTCDSGLSKGTLFNTSGVTVKSPSFRPAMLSNVRKLTGEHASGPFMPEPVVLPGISKQGGTVGGKKAGDDDSGFLAGHRRLFSLVPTTIVHSFFPRFSRICFFGHPPDGILPPLRSCLTDLFCQNTFLSLYVSLRVYRFGVLSDLFPRS
jgi:hypothetical protein